MICLVFALVMTLMPRFSKSALQQVPGGLIQLSIHQMAGEVQHGHFHPTHAQAGCRLKAQQAATNDNGGGFPTGSGVDHCVGVFQITVADDAGKVVAGQRNNEGR